MAQLLAAGLNALRVATVKAVIFIVNSRMEKLKLSDLHFFTIITPKSSHFRTRQL